MVSDEFFQAHKSIQLITAINNTAPNLTVFKRQVNKGF